MSRFLFLATVLIGRLAFCDAARAIDVTIDPGQQKQLITDWGYDVKEPGRAGTVTPEFARQIFVDDGMTCLRVPIYGDANHPAHPREGKVDASYYQDILTAMANARAARPDVIFFASKRLENTETFPPWVLGPRGVIPEKYARLLADYLQFMQAQGYPIDVLGPDNEMEWNKGNITPEKEWVIERELKSLSVSRGFKMPKLVAPESFDPKANWVRKAISLGAEIDIVGTHYYPDRPFRKLQDLVLAAGSHPLWNTELHCGSPKHDDQLEATLATFFDCTDEGFSGFVWWAYSRGGRTNGIERAVTKSTSGARPVAVSCDEHQEDIRTHVIIRAFRRVDQVVLWGVNGTSQDENCQFHLANGKISSAIGFQLWRQGESVPGVVAPPADPTGFAAVLPAGTVMEFTLSLQPGSSSRTQ